MDLLNEIVQSPAIIKEIYGDLAKPGVQQAGKALSTIIGLGNTLLWPAALLNEKAKIALESNLDKYRKKIQHIPEEEICGVAPEIGIPIAEKLSYVTNEELSDMYTELLAKASYLPKVDTAHPGFVNIINNISPDEAILIDSIRNKKNIPYIDVRLQQTDKSGWVDLNPMIPSLSCLSKLKYPNNIQSYISNLEGLGVLQVRSDLHLVGENIYEPLEDQVKSQYASLHSSTDHTLDIKRGKIVITPFAQLFMIACF